MNLRSIPRTSSLNPVQVFYSVGHLKNPRLLLYPRKPKRSSRRLLKKVDYIKKRRRFSKIAYPHTSYTKQPINLAINTPIRLRNDSNAFNLKNSPLFIHYKFKVNNAILYPLKHELKKSLFSFLKPNQIRRGLMLRRQKISYYRFFKRFTLKFNLGKQNASSYIKLLNINDKLKRLNSSIAPSSAHNTLLFNGYTDRIGSIDYDKPFNIATSPYENWRTYEKEVFIDRVRFKPGYQRI